MGTFQYIVDTGSEIVSVTAIVGTPPRIVTENEEVREKLEQYLKTNQTFTVGEGEYVDAVPWDNEDFCFLALTSLYKIRKSTGMRFM